MVPRRADWWGGGYQRCRIQRHLHCYSFELEESPLKKKSVIDTDPV